MKLSKSQRAEVFAMFGGRCAYCGVELPLQGWHADHIEPVVRDGKWVKVIGDPHRSHKYVQTGTCQRPENQRVDNFYPACRACNIEKSCGSIEDFRAGLERKVMMLRRDNAAFRHAERFGIVVHAVASVVFYFERVARERVDDCKNGGFAEVDRGTLIYEKPYGSSPDRAISG